VKLHNCMHAASLTWTASRGAGELVRLVLLKVEAHAALTQAIAAIVSMLIAATALIYAVRSLNALQRQTEASIALTTETFRPIIEVLGGSLREGQNPSEIDFVNKGNGAALNFRWKVDEEPERWGGYTSNIIAPQEKGNLKATNELEEGTRALLQLVAHREEIRTYVNFGSTGPVSNSLSESIHSVGILDYLRRDRWLPRSNTDSALRLGANGSRSDFSRISVYWDGCLP